MRKVPNEQTSRVADLDNDQQDSAQVAALAASQVHPESALPSRPSKTQSAPDSAPIDDLGHLDNSAAANTGDLLAALRVLGVTYDAGWFTAGSCMARATAEEAAQVAVEMVEERYGILQQDYDLVQREAGRRHCRHCDATTNADNAVEICDACADAAPAADAVVQALKGEMPLVEPVHIGKALRAGRQAKVCLSGGTGPLACVMLCNIQLSPWIYTEDTAKAFADGYNRALDHLRSALLEVAAQDRAGATSAACLPELTVWEGAMPESNGKSNFTAVLHRKDSKGFDLFTDGFQFARSEYPDRVKYEADFMRWLIGEREVKPELLGDGYDFDKHSGYVPPDRTAVKGAGGRNG
jgi:hypothetical protein